MKHKAFVLLAAVSSLSFVYCSSRTPDSETLLHYARAKNVYSEGRFREAALMLAGEKKFVPALVLKGKAEYLYGDLVTAEKTLKRALKLSPANTEASLFLAKLFREKGNQKEAQKLADKILADNSADIRTLRFAAELARDRGASGEAASAILLDRAVEASSESAMVFMDRARLRWTGGNHNGALEDLGRAKVLLPNESPVMNAVETLESIIHELSYPGAGK